MSFTCKSVFNVLHEVIDDLDFQMTVSYVFSKSIYYMFFYAQQNTHEYHNKIRLCAISFFIQKVSQGVTDDPMFVNKILAM